MSDFFETTKPDEYIPFASRLVPYPYDVKNCFFVEAQGNKMEPDIYPGDLLLCHKTQAVEAGNIVIVRMNKTNYVRKVIKHDNGMMFLVDNKLHTLVAHGDVEILGKVISKITRHDF